jgi:hypothetical protein
VRSLPFRRFDRNGAAVMLGALVTVLAASTLSILYPAADDAAIEVPMPARLAGESSAGAARRASPDEIRAYLNDMFDRLDRDGSGYVEPAEAPRRQVMSTRLSNGSIRQWPLTQAEWFAQGDGDRDGRVTRNEYFSRLLPPVQSVLGVPANWRPGAPDRPAQAPQHD